MRLIAASACAVPFNSAAFDHFPCVLVSPFPESTTCIPNILPRSQVPPSSHAICTLASGLERVPPSPTFSCAPCPLSPPHDHLQVASIPPLLDWFPSYSSRQPHTIPIPHDDLRGGRFDPQINAVFPPHTHPFRERSSCSFSFP